MPFQQLRGSSGCVPANAAAPLGSPLPPPRGADPFPLFSLLYASWGGAPPFGAADMMMYERWRCRTLALRAFTSPATLERRSERGAPSAAPPPEGPSTCDSAGGAGGCLASKGCRQCAKMGGIEEEAARRAEGFALLRQCLPPGIPMELVERTAWSECLSYFCKRETSCRLQWSGSSRAAESAFKESSGCFSQPPVSLPYLVARLAHRLWYLLPGSSVFFVASVGGAGVLELLPPWFSFLCEEIVAFFLFVLLHMKALIGGENGAYVHLTDREWTSRFRQLRWLLSCCPVEEPLRPALCSSLAPAQHHAEGSKAEAQGELPRLEGGRNLARRGASPLDGSLPPLDCIDASLTEYFPMNPRSAPHAFWLLFDRENLLWTVTTESYAVRSFPVLASDAVEGPLPEEEQRRGSLDGGRHGASENFATASSPKGKPKRKPLPSLVDAAREDALRFLCLLGALPPSDLAGNVNYLLSLYDDADRPYEKQQQQEEKQEQQQEEKQEEKQQQVVNDDGILQIDFTIVSKESHCEKGKKAFVCDEQLRTLTGRARLPQQREALAKTLKSVGLIEHFMIDPRDLKGT
ncbi:hypothetical protein cyc_03228 [Cyclospora cayetanensis]|uniref:Uncharacterized protein n=1 Tax=Cyclospora cayetanensis TaxID=88456 RepID=A0A1D3CV79_9EIME|nr:hypothetical protein cyc_03228 [Cyclospora cayetanensis]